MSNAVDVNTILTQARDQRLWGTVEISFQDGKIVLVKRTETFKISSAEGTTRVSNRP